MKPAPAPFRWLLRFYPEAFRQTYGREMERMFARMLARERESRGLAGALSVWVGATVDAARSGLRERRILPSGRRRIGGVMDALRIDIRQALRGFLSRPVFTLAAVLTIALGIGANSAIFSIVNASMLRPLPYRDSDRLVLLWQTWQQYGSDEIPWTTHDFVDVRARMTQLSRIALFRGGSRVLNTAEPRRLRAAVVSPDLFPLLGVAPALGRGFVPEEEIPANRDRVILTHATWQQLSGSNPAVVGTTITLDDRPHTIVGVMPAGFAFPPPVTFGDKMLAMNPEIFLPFSISPGARDGNHSHFALARLAPGASIPSADAELRAIHADLAKAYPVNVGVEARAIPLQGQSVSTFRRSLLIMLAAVLCVLLIACTSVANLLIAKATARRRELALRAAVGASRSRLVGQLLVESLTLGVFGGAIGLVLALWIIAGVSTLNPIDLPAIYEPRLDWRVVAFTFGVTLVAVTAFGLLPALQASRPDPIAVFRDGARTTAGRSERRMKSALVVGQTAIAVLLLVLAGLAVRSFRTLWSVDPGFETQSVLSFHVDLPESRYRSSTDAWRFIEALTQELSNLPGTASTAAATMLPFVFDRNATNYFVEGEPATADTVGQFVDRTLITPSYFTAMGSAVVWGRPILPSDTGSVAVGVVNEAFARKHWPGGDWSDRRIALDALPAANDGWIQIVGVARDMRTAGLSNPAEPTLYLPLAAEPYSSFFVLMRTNLDPAASVAPARAALARLDPALPMDNVKLMSARKADSVRAPRFTAMLLGGFGILALIIAIIGIYGVMAFDAAQRTREIGIRIALGARPASVRGLISRRGLLLTATGLAIGLVASVAASRAVEGMLYGVSGSDPATLAVAAVTLLVTGWAAAWLPARRASNVDPIVALRAD